MIAKAPFDGTAATAERFGVQANWKITDSINFAAWGGSATAQARGGTRDGDKADRWTWNADKNFPIQQGKIVPGIGIQMNPLIAPLAAVLGAVLLTKRNSSISRCFG